jgi:putative transposase
MARDHSNTLVRFDEGEIQSYLAESVKKAVRDVFEAVMEAEAQEMLQARPYERTTMRRDYRNGKRQRKLVTRVGEIELDVPRLRTVPFQSQIIDRYKRMECSLEEALIEMYLQGISTRKIAGITEELLGAPVSAGSMSRLNHKVYDKLKAWRERPLEQTYPYLYLDGTVIKARWAGAVERVSLLVAVGVTENGHREILGCELGSTESTESWLGLLRSLKKRGVRTVNLVIADAHAGIRAALEKCFTTSDYQRCIFHFINNVLTQVPRKKQASVATALKAIFAQESETEARAKASRFIEQNEKTLAQATKTLKAGLSDALTYYRYPETHWRRIRTNNPLERLLLEVKRRLKVVGAFPDPESAMMLATARLKWMQETQWGSRRYLDIGGDEKAAA